MRRILDQVNWMQRQLEVCGLFSTTEVSNCFEQTTVFLPRKSSLRFVPSQKSIQKRNSVVQTHPTLFSRFRPFSLRIYTQAFHWPVGLFICFPWAECFQRVGDTPVLSGHAHLLSLGALVENRACLSLHAGSSMAFTCRSTL